jgi:hypothetical protein
MTAVVAEVAVDMFVPLQLAYQVDIVVVPVTLWVLGDLMALTQPVVLAVVLVSQVALGLLLLL